MNTEITVNQYVDHPYNSTIKNERAVELPLAFNYISWIVDVLKENLIEVGAVTPYYKNVTHTIVDPQDSKATLKEFSDKIDFSEKNVLSISTIEHIGTGDYGLQPGADAFSELNRIYSQCKRCLITWPTGYNKQLDQNTKLSIDRFKYFFYYRSNNIWVKSTDIGKFEIPYGPFGNSIVCMLKQ